MAEAGFYYIGLSDKVKCFYCDIPLNEWCEDDDPWVEHAGFSHTCGFLRLTKGDLFIKQARQLVDMRLVSTDMVIYHLWKPWLYEK